MSSRSEFKKFVPSLAHRTRAACRRLKLGRPLPVGSQARYAEDAAKNVILHERVRKVNVKAPAKKRGFWRRLIGAK